MLRSAAHREAESPEQEAGRTVEHAPIHPPIHAKKKPPARRVSRRGLRSRPQPARPLFVQLLVLALPIMAEQVLNIIVGLTDTYLANNLVPTESLSGPALEAARQLNATAAAAVGSGAYITWFLGLMTAAVGTGSTALIARAIGARERRLANSAVGQSVVLAIAAGLPLGAAFYLLAGPIASAFQLDPAATAFLVTYLQVLAVGVPLAMCIFIVNACLRGAGDTITPAIAMIVLDVVNIVLSFSLCYGWGPIPRLGFSGIVWGTSIAYGGGSLVVLTVLIVGIGRSGLRLYPHRLRPSWHTIRRILRIGVPSGGEGLIHWGANFVVIAVINTLGSIPAAAHVITIRLESLSYMMGFGVATAAATLVGQSLGMNNPARARRSGYLAYLFGGGLMGTMGLVFILIPHQLAGFINDGPDVSAMTAGALRIAGFTQLAFAAQMIFGGALRGAGDTLKVMVLNLSSSLTVRMLGAIIVVKVLGYGLSAVWLVLGLDLCVRGTLMFVRFYGGAWTGAKV